MQRSSIGKRSTAADSVHLIDLKPVLHDPTNQSKLFVQRIDGALHDPNVGPRKDAPIICRVGPTSFANKLDRVGSCKAGFSETESVVPPPCKKRISMVVNLPVKETTKRHVLRPFISITLHIKSDMCSWMLTIEPYGPYPLPSRDPL